MRNLLLLAIAALFACNNAPKAPSDKDSVTTTDIPATDSLAGTTCYMKAVGKDTFLLQMIVNGDQVAGKLNYNFFEKDKNNGTITGVLKDNILRASYSYQSEGMNSHRPVVFKIVGGQAYEAITDQFDSMGVPIFPTSDSQLKFEPTPYKKEDCK